MLIVSDIFRTDFYHYVNAAAVLRSWWCPPDENRKKAQDLANRVSTAKVLTADSKINHEEVIEEKQQTTVGICDTNKLLEIVLVKK